jgi:hypothetical protein
MVGLIYGGNAIFCFCVCLCLGSSMLSYCLFNVE